MRPLKRVSADKQSNAKGKLLSELAPNEWIGHIDVPNEGDTVVVGSEVYCSGWHALEDHESLLVIASIVAEPVGVSLTGSIQRPDVVLAYSDSKLENSGWSIRIPTTVTTPNLRINFALLTLDGAVRAHIGSRSVRVVDPTVDTVTAGHLDLPLTGEPLARAGVVVSGWATSPIEPVSRVDLYVNGALTQHCRIGVTRLDVNSVDYPFGFVSGFECLLDLTSIPDAIRSIELMAICETLSGEQTIIGKQIYDLKPRDVEIASKLVVLDRFPLPESVSRTEQEVIPIESDQRLNVLIFTHHLGWGGAQLWLHELLKQSRAGINYHATVIAPRTGPLKVDLENMGIEVHLSGDIPLDDISLYQDRLDELCAWIMRRDFDVILLNTFLAFPGATIAERMNLPYVWAIHESWPPHLIWLAGFPADSVAFDIKAITTRALGSARRVVFEAESTRNEYLSVIPSESAIVVRYGVDTASINSYCLAVSKAEARRNAGLGEDSFVVLMLGTIEPRKAQSLVIQAVASIIGLYGHLRLVLVGASDSPHVVAVRSLIDALQLDDVVLLIEVTGEIYQWYRVADLFVCASDVESLPRSVLEAMCFSLPVLSTDVFGLGELIVDSVNGFLYRPNSVKEVVNGLKRVLSLDSSKLVEVGESAKALVQTRYDSKEYASVMVSLLSQCVSPE